MFKYLFLVISLMPYVALTSGFDKTQDVTNPLDLLAQSSVAENCNEMSDTEPDDDEETITQLPVEIIDLTINEQLDLMLGKKRPLENPEDNIKPQKKAKKSQKKYKCTYNDCDYTTTFPNKLKFHFCKHTGEKPYKCPYESCNYSAKRKTHLTNHIKTHTGEKPFKCDFASCNYRAARKDHLVLHKRTHKGEKPFRCNFAGCNYEGARKDYLVLHKKNRHSVSKAPCSTDTNVSSKSAVINLLINAGKDKTESKQ